MKAFVLFYDNQETGVSGYKSFQGTSYEWIFIIFNSLNPNTTITIVEI